MEGRDGGREVGEDVILSTKEDGEVEGGSGGGAACDSGQRKEVFCLLYKSPSRAAVSEHSCSRQATSHPPFSLLQSLV